MGWGRVGPDDVVREHGEHRVQAPAVVRLIDLLHGLRSMASNRGPQLARHHIFDLLHGGDPTAPANVLPMKPEVHKAINSAYPACYTRGAQWSAVGPDRPYVDSP